jgi:hypothetical protein
MDNALSRYYDGINAAVEELRSTRALAGTGWFQPDWDLPARSERLDAFFAPATLSGAQLGEYRGHPLWLLDMTGNPGTRTTKTFGSALIVARALRHIEKTGEPVLLLTPSAANKAVALRDAVERAYRVGLATPETLRATVVVPSSSLPKLWDSPLMADPALRAANPVGVFDGPEREDVKRLATGAVELVEREIHDSTGFRLWYTLDPMNYMVADVVRAYFERDELAPGDATRWHTHTVSSAYGFLGHDLGRRLSRREGSWTATGHARYLFVQHLETPDLVTGLRFGDRPGYTVPDYRLDAATGLYRQQEPADPHFPSVCYAHDERVERTFYTRNPPTLPRVQELAARQGGDGIVVSLHECLERYQEVRALLSAGGMTRLPLDPRKLHEFAMVMATVGALTAIDRGLVPDGEEMLIHGSGAYSEGEFTWPDRSALQPVATPAHVADLLRDAAKA